MKRTRNLGEFLKARREGLGLTQLAGPEARSRSEPCCFYRKRPAQTIAEISRTHCRHAWTRSAGGFTPRPSGSERSPVPDRIGAMAEAAAVVATIHQKQRAPGTDSSGSAKAPLSSEA